MVGVVGEGGEVGRGCAGRGQPVGAPSPAIAGAATDDLGDGGMMRHAPTRRRQQWQPAADGDWRSLTGGPWQDRRLVAGGWPAGGC